MSTLRALLLGVYGYWNYTKAGFERRLGSTISDESVKNVGTMTNKVCIVTGANSGLGYQTSIDLAKRGCTLHLLCRNEERGKEAVQNIIKESNNEQVYLHIVDMSSVKSIKQFLDSQIGNTIPKLNILVNNAGAIVERIDPVTKTAQVTLNENGYENNFLVNTIGPYYLTRELINFMEESAKKDKDASRVIFVSSGGMLTSRLDLNNLQNQGFTGASAYAHCKRQSCCITEEWAKLHDKSLITFNSCHPGWVDTPGLSISLPTFYEKLKGNLRTLEQGADCQLYLAVSDEVKESTGLFFEDRKPVTPHFTLAFTQESEQERKELIKKCDSIIQDLMLK
ncbi:predicted protein [Naegleria gruberi]|uniref:Predicted protein n=1 Tax=Naegleria gruberi TaxID=5762 RepID=D2W2N1_NAEGR|nr:uncharacterized protein NAEGRDRAFT_61019 [Naegleria gruberi]EFC36644.1 predicted protein [Naegleria gruberi]|eukprot:XP_002669388.1 predicted protein [Naegleria gruberi strain NEG-M]